MTALAAYRDDGPIAAQIPNGALPLPGVILFGLAGLAPLMAWLSPAGRAWTLLAGVLLALLGTAGTGTRRLDWPVPGLLRLLEYGAVLLLVGDVVWTYALLLTLAFHHYDVVYRLRGEGPTPSTYLASLAGGWELRTMLMIFGSFVGQQRVVAAGLAVLLAPLFVTESVAAWRR